MKKPSLLCAVILHACTLSAQPSFQTSLQAGVSLPFNSNDINGTHAGKAIHFGNHLDYSFGDGALRFGLGAYIGYLNCISTDNKYKAVGEAIAEKYRLPSSNLIFNSAAFKSTHILLGPIASFGSAACSINIWAKGGYGLNEPSRYAVLYKEGNIINNVYTSQGAEHKNGLAYSAGAGIRCAISEYIGLQLAAGYFSTQTDQVNYNFDREKGTAPQYSTAANQFIQASAGLQFTIGNPGKKSRTVRNDADTSNPVAARMDQKIKTKSNIKNDRVIGYGENDTEQSRIYKSKSNVKNNRMDGDAGDIENNADDSLFFTPAKIELRTSLTAGNRIQLQSVDNYLTGFAYQSALGAVLSQCGASAMPGEPIPGIDVKLKRVGGTGTEMLSTHTNKDGSFAFNNIAPGDYTAETGNAKMDITVNGNNNNGIKTLDVMGGSCGATKENYIIQAGDKTYVEITAAKALTPRDAASGLPTGRRMHKPYRVADTDFDINTSNIVSNDGKFYAEVMSSREAGSGMASGRRNTIVTGDVDADGFSDNAVMAPRDAASGLATGRRMHKPMVITKELDMVTGEEEEEFAARDAGSGMATGRRQYQPLLIRIDPDEDSYELVSPRDAASGLPTGKRMHKPFVVTKELGYTAAGDEVTVYRIIHRDLAARNSLANEAGAKGIITGKDNETGMAAGKFFSKKGYDYYKARGEDIDEGIVSNPLYEQTGTSGVNPLFEAKGDLRVVGSNGKAHAIFIPGNILLQTAGNAAVTPFAAYEVMPVKWIAPEVISNEKARKGIHENGIKKNETAARKGWDGTVKGGSKGINEAGISEKGINQAGFTENDELARKGWDGTVKGGSKGINEAGISAKGINQAGIKKNDAAARKGWDGTVKGGAIVKEISRLHCADGSCIMDAIVEVDGKEYEAVITGVLKTKHDTAKNSVGNIR
ncbi:MAG: hypothetical protein ABIQ88_04265 [Chitinophagaceae bacterium]